MTEFHGRLCAIEGGAVCRVRGRYEWTDRLTPEPRVVGTIVVRGLSEVERSVGWTDPFAFFGQSQFRGRACRLTIPTVGVSPVRLYSGSWEEGVAFEAWSPPIPDATQEEVVEALWTPIYDALQGAGHPDLAELARAAAVAIQGFRIDTGKAKMKGRYRRLTGTY